jgi:hypothetical protein
MVSPATDHPLTLRVGAIALQSTDADRATPESGHDPGQRLTYAEKRWVDWLQWRFLFLAPCELLSSHAPTSAERHFTLASGPLRLAVTRRLGGAAAGLQDRVSLHNVGLDRLPLSVELNLGTTLAVATVTLTHITFGDGSALELDPLAAARPDGADWELSLEVDERIELLAHWSPPLTP